MTRALFLPLLFLFSTLVETSFLESLPRPFSLVPLLFVIGVVLLHRVGIAEGVTWFVLSGLGERIFGFQEPFFWHLIVVGIVGAFLTKQTFAHRSLYALLALGASLFFLERTLEIISREVAHLFSKLDYLLVSDVFSRMPRDFLVFIVSLYVAYLIAQYIEFLLRKVFYLR